MNLTKERFLVTEKFDATGIGELDQCSSILGAETDDKTIVKDSYVLAYPEKDGFRKFTSQSTLATFCVRSSIFNQCTKRDQLKQQEVI